MRTAVPTDSRGTPAPGESASVRAPDANDELREFAIARLKRRRKFVNDALRYLAVNGVLWLIWALADRSTDGWPWPAWVSAIWGFFLAADAWRAFGPWPRSLLRPITEADIDRELMRGRTG